MRVLLRAHRLPHRWEGCASDDYLTFSREENALDYLERAGRFIDEARSDPAAWKWVTVALHGALYGFALCACHTGHYLDITEGGKGRRTVSVRKALEFCQNQERMSMTIYGQPLVLTARQGRALDIIIDGARNQFQHFGHLVFSLELRGMPEVALEVLDVVEFLALSTNTYVILEDDEDQRARNVLEKAREMLLAMANT